MQTFDFETVKVAALWDKPTGSWQYILTDKASGAMAIIDPVLEFDSNAAATSTANADELLAYCQAQGGKVEWILDTHPHADHFSAAPYLADKLGAPRAIGEKVVGVQKLWADIYCLDDLRTDGSQWDRIFANGEVFDLGATKIEVMFTPGHTLASIAYVTDEVAFVHDTLMMPDSGTSRADFPGGSSKELYDSIQRLLALPEETSLFVGHDYAPEGREAQCCATVAEQRKNNKHVGNNRSEADFIALRDERDGTLPLPKLMLAALQINIRGGHLPEPEPCGRSFLKIPLDYFPAKAANM